jgi:hypothetical protein
MRAIREPSLAAPLVLVTLGLFFGGGPVDGPVTWLGAGAIVALLALLALRGVPGGWPAVVPLAALAVWCALSIAWSWLPDRSWDYANRTAVYALFAMLGLYAAGRTRDLARGLAAAFGAVIAWSLLGKVVPPVYDYGGFDIGRLRGPIGLWNQLALVTAYALALSLAIRGRAGRLLAYLALVALVLTYSRGGILTAALVVAAWFGFSEERDEAAASLVVAAIPAAAVGAIAFLLPGVTSDHQASSARWRDGLVFGALLLAGAGIAWAIDRRRLTRVQMRVVAGAAVVVAIAGAVVVVVEGVGSGAVTNGGQHVVSTSSNFRFTWWRQAWEGFTHHVVAGTGGGSFHVLNVQYRRNYLDYTIEPHDLPLQMLAELGVVGLAIFVLACALLLKPGLRRRGNELALALLLPAFLVHALVDIDWDFASVAVPAFVAAGSLAGRPPARRVGIFQLLPAAGVALVLVGALFSPWLARRYSNDALSEAFTKPKHAFTLADRAHSLDPLLIEPLWAKALAADTKGQVQRAFRYYVEAVERQPRNAQTWRAAGQYAWDLGCPYQAWKYLERYTELDQKARRSAGGATYERALKLVDARKYRC